MASLTTGEFVVRFALATLAVWRVTHFLVSEDGPWDVVSTFRAKLGNTFWGRLMDCFYCLSVWIAAPLAPWIGRTLAETGLVWLALSGAACLLERATAAPVTFQQLKE